MATKRDPMKHPLIIAMKSDGVDVEYVRTDDLGDHYVSWLMYTTSQVASGIWFYIDQINVRVVVERIGS